MERELQIGDLCFTSKGMIVVVRGYVGRDRLYVGPVEFEIGHFRAAWPRDELTYIPPEFHKLLTGVNND